VYVETASLIPIAWALFVVSVAGFEATAIAVVRRLGDSAAASMFFAVCGTTRRRASRDDADLRAVDDEPRVAGGPVDDLLEACEETVRLRAAECELRAPARRQREHLRNPPARHPVVRRAEGQPHRRGDGGAHARSDRLQVRARHLRGVAPERERERRAVERGEPGDDLRSGPLPVEHSTDSARQDDGVEPAQGERRVAAGNVHRLRDLPEQLVERGPVDAAVRADVDAEDANVQPAEASHHGHSARAVARFGDRPLPVGEHAEAARGDGEPLSSGAEHERLLRDGRESLLQEPLRLAVRQAAHVDALDANSGGDPVARALVREAEAEDPCDHDHPHHREPSQHARTRLPPPAQLIAGDRGVDPQDANCRGRLERPAVTISCYSRGIRMSRAITSRWICDVPS
jgi:hypothetical protein